MENNNNRKKILLFLFCLIGALLVGFFIGHYYKGVRKQNKNKWVCVYNSKNTSMYYNPSRIIYTQDGNVRVWVKFTGKNEKDNAIKLGDENGIPAEKYNNWAYDIELWEFNCKNQTARMISYLSYTKKNVINFYNKPTSTMGIPPNTRIDDIYQAVCNNHTQGD